jgi:hypothetical protein
VMGDFLWLNSFVHPTFWFDHRPSTSSTGKLKTLHKFRRFDHRSSTNLIK